MLSLGFVKRNFVCESKKNFLMTFPIGCIVSFCSKTLPLNTPLFEETVFEKSQVILVDSKLAAAFDGVFCVRVRTFEITE